MSDPDSDVFRNALSDFVFDAACGGAIRHLADSGCTVRQIMERLDYPISQERVRKALYKHLCDTGVILEKNPEEEMPEAKPEYVLEYNSYGRPSYRRKNTAGAGESAADPGQRGKGWTEIVYTSGMAFSPPVYVSCDFGIPDSLAAGGICLLNGRQQEYLEGIPWPHHRVYHRLDHRMKEIICRLYEQNSYEGVCYFISDRKKLEVHSRRQ